MEKEQLEYRLRQQALISELGLCALDNRDFASLAQEAVRIAAEGVRSKFAKVAKYLPDQNCFLICAGVGWKEGVVGTATVGADLESPSGYALFTGQPVISNHLARERRFRTPTLLVEHGIKRAINVIIGGATGPFGVLEADSPSERAFDEYDTEFLQATANVLAAGLDRRRAEDALEKASVEKDVLLRDKDMLLNELNHRVKNNLQVVSSLLVIEAARLEDPVAKERFRAVGKRVDVLSRVHGHLYRSRAAGDIEFGGYLRELCEGLQAFYRTPQTDMTIITDLEPVTMDVDRAVPLALIANELIANSAKHAFPGRRKGTVRVGLRRCRGNLLLTVADDGRGIPAVAPEGLGRELVQALSKQIGAVVEVRVERGTTVTVKLSQKPRQRAT